MVHCSKNDSFLLPKRHEILSTLQTQACLFTSLRVKKSMPFFSGIAKSFYTKTPRSQFNKNNRKFTGESGIQTIFLTAARPQNYSDDGKVYL